MCKMLDQYSDKIKGSFSFFDRMIIMLFMISLTNTLNPSFFIMHVVYLLARSPMETFVQ